MAKTIIRADAPSLSAVGTALRLDLVEVGRSRLAKQSIGRKWPAVRHDVADPDFRIAGARVVALLCRGRTCCNRKPKRNEGESGTVSESHDFLHVVGAAVTASIGVSGGLRV